MSIESIWRWPYRAVSVMLGHGAAVMMAGLLGLTAPLAADQPDTDPPPDQPAAADEEQPPPEPIPADGPSYAVSAFAPQYVRGNPQLPPIDDVMQIEVDLVQTTQGYVAPREGVPSVRLRLADIAERPVEQYYGSAIQEILVQIRDFFSNAEILGVYVAPDPFEINEEGRDLRPADQTALRILVTTGVVTELRTLASGDRIDPEQRINHPLHERIREQSPIRPYQGLGEAPDDLLRKDVLDRYMFHLSRHPGRRVDASISPAQEPGGVALDYLITENKPFATYFQVSNTGTRSTERWRERFGFYNTQLTNHDDILEFSYTTAGFSDTNAVSASYERPFPNNDRLRWRAHARWGEFTASDVGFFADDFTGESWALGGDITANIYQNRELFVDLFGGARVLYTQVSNPLVGEGQETFFLPQVGLRLARNTDWMSTTGSLSLEWQIAGITGVESAELTRLGRTLPDDDWAVLRWGFTQTVFLEPLLNREAWEDPSTPESSSLAHELAFSLRGQYAFDHRLIPSLEQPLGGLYTVRGYPESVVAGDTVVIGSLEYRYYYARDLPIEEEPRTVFGRTFRHAPQYVYGPTDWDLIFKGFLDVGQVVISDQLPFEQDETLVGAGVGVELHYRRNFRVRLDWGFVLEELQSAGVNSGSNRLHVVATFLF